MSYQPPWCTPVVSAAPLTLRERRAAQLLALVQELSDAHLDTIQLVGDADLGLDWALHIDYIRRLRNVTEHALATVATADGV